MTPQQLRRAAHLLFYAPTAQDADERLALIDAFLAEANRQETRP